LVPVSLPTDFAQLQRDLETHAALGAARLYMKAANAEVEAARVRRFADPSLSVFQERDFLAGRRKSFTGVMLNVQIPLWNLNNGTVAAARAQVDKARSLSQARRRDLASRLRQSHTHLSHLIEQVERYQQNLLKPAQEVFDLTRKGFAAGELNILALVDANDTYFDARVRYLELLYSAWLESAELRLAAGRPLADRGGEVAP
jgi:cobalt-zinc-cadmium efflux system outer membrane protein